LALQLLLSAVGAVRFNGNNDNETNLGPAHYHGYFDLRITLGKADDFICDSADALAEGS
jgi:hypothetical protein